MRSSLLAMLRRQQSVAEESVQEAHSSVNQGCVTNKEEKGWYHAQGFPYRRAHRKINPLPPTLIVVRPPPADSSFLNCRP